MLRSHRIAAARNKTMPFPTWAHKFLNALARVVGVLFICGGLFALVGAAMFPADRIVVILAGVFFVGTGIACFLAKPVREEDVEKLRQKVRAFKQHS